MKKQTNDFAGELKYWIFMGFCIIIVGTTISQISKYLKFNFSQVIFMAVTNLSFFLFGVFENVLIKILKEKLK